MKDDPLFARLCVLSLATLIGLCVVVDGVLLALGLPSPAGITALAGILVGALIALAGPRTSNGQGKPSPPAPPPPLP